MSPHDAPVNDKSPQALRQGLTVFNRFRLGPKLGQGRLGTVWLANELAFDRQVVLKILNETLVRDSKILADLQQKTKRATELRHPNLARIHEFLTDGNMAAVCQEHVKGDKISNLRRKEAHRCFTAQALKPWVAQLCSALSYAHGKALMLHGNLKPSNLMIDRRGNLRITDFGLTASMPDETAGLGQTEGGTEEWFYRSPQQRKGEAPTATDDIYSLGAILFELLSSKQPFPSGTPLAQIQDKAIPSIEERRANLEIVGMDPVPDDWERTIAACLAKEPGERPQSAKEVADRLHIDVEPLETKQGENDKQSEAPGTEALKDTAKPEGRPRKTVRGIILGVGATALILALGYVLGFYLPEHRRQEAARQRLEQAQLRWKTTRQEQARGGMIVETQPSGVEVRVGELAAKSSPATFDNLRLSEYQVNLRKAGYEDQNFSLKIEDNKITEAKGIKMRLSLGAALVASEPEGLDYVLESRELAASDLPKVLRRGKTPAQEKDLPIGAYILSYHREGWQDRSMELTVARNVQVQGKMDLVGGSLSLNSEPSGLDFTVEASDAGTLDTALGQRSGKTPARIDGLPLGHYMVKVKRPGWPEQSALLELSRDALAEKNFRFSSGSLDLKSKPAGVTWKIQGLPPGVSLGKVQGITPERLEELPVGDYELSLQRQGGWAPQRSRVSIKPGQVSELQTDFPSGRTSINSKPTGAEVLIGKKSLGLTPLTIHELAPGPVLIELRLQGYQSARIATEITAGKDLTLNQNLIAFSGPNEGSRWVVPGLDLSMVPIDAGQFVMGSPENEPGHQPDETQFTVVIARPFWLGSTEVTQGQYESLMGTNPSYYAKLGKNAPVEQVNWEEAMTFCLKLTERERAAGRLPADYEYSLPTEAQWEYACRAGTPGPFDGDLVSIAWYDANSGSSTHPVSGKRANAWDLHDMQGNVWEWCYDWYGDYPSGIAREPCGPESGSERVYRGGCWGNAPRGCRAAIRNKGAPKIHVSGLGFRVALVPSAL